MTPLVDVVPMRERGLKRSAEFVRGVSPLRGTIRWQPAREMVSPHRWAGPMVAIFCPEDLGRAVQRLPPLDQAWERKRGPYPRQWVVLGIEEAQFGRAWRPAPQAWWVRLARPDAVSF